MTDHGEPEMASPPGFRFFPTEDELVSFYLHNKLLPDGDDNLNRAMDRIIPVRDIYAFNPWDLPQKSGAMEYRDEPEQWFFFVPRQESEARGGKPKRLTKTGYWKATGSPGLVYSRNNRAIGVKKSMVFYIGRAPNGTKTVWKMNEYKAIVDSAPPPAISSTGVDPELVRQDYSLCRLYKKSKFTRAFDRRPSAPPEVLVGDVDEATLAAKQHPHRNYDSNGHDYGASTHQILTNSVDEAPRDYDDHHNIIGYDHGPPMSTSFHEPIITSAVINENHHQHYHNHQNNIGFDHGASASTPMLNPRNSFEDMLISSSSSSWEHRFHNADYFNDQAFFSSWDLDICFNGI